MGDFNLDRDVQEWVSHSQSTLSDILAFNQCILHGGLEDLQSTGCEFTWTNKQDGLARVWSKLDSVMVNSTWLQHFPSTTAVFLPLGISDHSPALVTIFEEVKRTRRFNFLNFWVEDSKGFHQLVN
ncbi:hypothetical protein RND81_12G148900 [Saponaria officinalis]|uniref:Endonuclease/exonuclease/phosphatase domain-containing protein n=1 Tax=Saponaria officinalis TaxID=3572 RepID=A0AAW1HAQ8_SAPOF